jgi:hypothetical protein
VEVAGDDFTRQKGVKIGEIPGPIEAKSTLQSRRETAKSQEAAEGVK